MIQLASLSLQSQLMCVGNNRVTQICASFSHQICQTCLLVCDLSNCLCRSYLPYDHKLFSLSSFQTILHRLSTETTSSTSALNALTNLKEFYQQTINQLSLQLTTLDKIITNKPFSPLLPSKFRTLFSRLDQTNAKSISRQQIQDISPMLETNNQQIDWYFKEQEQKLMKKTMDTQKLFYRSLKQLRQMWNSHSDEAEQALFSTSPHKVHAQKSILEQFKIKLQQVRLSRKLSCELPISKQALEIVVSAIPNLISLDILIDDQKIVDPIIFSLPDLQTIKISFNETVKKAKGCSRCYDGMYYQQDEYRSHLCQNMSLKIKEIVKAKGKLKQLLIDSNEFCVNKSDLEIILKIAPSLQEIKARIQEERKISQQHILNRQNPFLNSNLKSVSFVASPSSRAQSLQSFFFELFAVSDMKQLAAINWKLSPESFIFITSINHSIVSLNVSFNQIQDEGLNELSRNLPCLQELAIQQCGVTDAGIMKLGSNVKSLLSLNAKNNWIKNKGILSLIKTNPQLNTLILYTQNKRNSQLIKYIKYEPKTIMSMVLNLQNLKILRLQYTSYSSSLFYLAKLKGVKLELIGVEFGNKFFIGMRKLLVNLRNKYEINIIMSYYMKERAAIDKWKSRRLFDKNFRIVNIRKR